MYSVDDAIAAIASAPGGAARGIIRLSGPRLVDCLNRCFGPLSQSALSTVRRPTAVEGHLSTGSAIGELPGALYFWPSTRSFTGQIAAEFHTIGSPPLLDAALHGLCSCDIRLAEPGEFTLRAFLAGRLDLTQAEAVLGVIEASNRDELDVALGQLAGGLAQPLNLLRDRLLDLLAHLEAGMDFVEDEVEFITTAELSEQLGSAQTQLDMLATQLSGRAQTSDRARVVLVGQPNVGKSSLFNSLADRGQAPALISATAGTTRDYLTATISWEGLSALLVDTAGIEEAAAATPRGVAQDMTSGQRRQADVFILCVDATRPRTSWESKALSDYKNHWIVVSTKTDIVPEFRPPDGSLLTSSKTGTGITELRDRIRDRIENHGRGPCGSVPSTASRCYESLLTAASCLRTARELVDTQSGEELVAFEVRAALDAVGRIVGAVYTDDLLDRIFSRFCIGK